MLKTYDVITRQAIPLAEQLPANLIEKLVQAIAHCDLRNWGYTQQQILQITPQPNFRASIKKFLDTWHEQLPELAPTSVAQILFATVSTMQYCREKQSVDLVWTGPGTMEIPLRRTEQALLEVIDAAQKTLWVVSFAVYKIPAITDALINAFERGVWLRICVEAPDPSGQRIAYDTIQALGREVQQRAVIYIWPRDQRPATPDGKVGSLHAKCAVADETYLFVSSANLTEYAMNLNMELGTLIKGGQLPGLVARHLERLVESGVLRQAEEKST